MRDVRGILLSRAARGQPPGRPISSFRHNPPETTHDVGLRAALGREVVACQPPADRTAAPSRSAPRFPSARTQNDLDFLAPLSLYVPPLLAAEEDTMTTRAVELLRAAADVVQALADMSARGRSAFGGLEV